jgi:hypothetical protein
MLFAAAAAGSATRGVVIQHVPRDDAYIAVRPATPPPSPPLRGLSPSVREFLISMRLPSLCESSSPIRGSFPATRALSLRGSSPPVPAARPLSSTLSKRGFRPSAGVFTGCCLRTTTSGHALAPRRGASPRPSADCSQCKLHLGTPCAPAPRRFPSSPSPLPGFLLSLRA